MDGWRGVARGLAGKEKGGVEAHMKFAATGVAMPAETRVNSPLSRPRRGNSFLLRELLSRVIRCT
jgi:hypothetical protein